MSNKFKAIVLNQFDNHFSREIKTLDKSFFKSGDVLVKVEYSSLNYKDALILKNGGKLVKEYPQIPGIDFSGKVVESDSTNFKKEDEVILTGCRVGEIYPGGYSQFVKVKNELLVKKPKEISNKNAMILGTAGFTSLLCAFAIILIVFSYFLLELNINTSIAILAVISFSLLLIPFYMLKGKSK